MLLAEDFNYANFSVQTMCSVAVPFNLWFTSFEKSFKIHSIAMEDWKTAKLFCTY
jgi:hypothetical protein